MDQRAARLHQTVATRAQQVARAKADLKLLEEEQEAIQRRVEAKAKEVTEKEVQLTALRSELDTVLKSTLCTSTPKFSVRGVVSNSTMACSNSVKSSRTIIECTFSSGPTLPSASWNVRQKCDQFSRLSIGLL